MDSVGLSARTKECGQCREVKIRVNIWTVSDCLPGPKIVCQCREVKRVAKNKSEYMDSVGLSARTKECGQCREVKIRVNICVGLSARTKECGQWLKSE